MKLKKEIHKRGLVKNKTKKPHQKQTSKINLKSRPISDSDRPWAHYPKLFNLNVIGATHSWDKRLQSTSLTLCEILEPEQRMRSSPAAEDPCRSISVTLHRRAPPELGFAG